jgi:hypothetical protein
VSRALAKGAQWRLDAYTRRWWMPTPRQRRRLRHKFNRARRREGRREK